MLQGSPGQEKGEQPVTHFHKPVTLDLRITATWVRSSPLSFPGAPPYPLQQSNLNDFDSRGAQLFCRDVLAGMQMPTVVVLNDLYALFQL